ncbi:MAG TPA: polysaccharide deacetylase family protein [Solirubrobacteraceae bacterium]|jgi:peptidoglycan/xylan/chitin deacetylase (PgdA/CDA1 family)|nr:polysaccharide deacetylase family protein [Solirubrobacteraceae bacterium]
MTRWDWTWEDRSQANRTPPVAPDESDEESGVISSAGSGPPPRRPVNHAVRRRRAGAAGLAIVLLVVLVAGLSSHTGSAGKTPNTLSKRHDATVRSLTPAERAAATVKGEENAVNSVLSYTPAVTSGGAHGNELALTFDDGPGPYTQQLVAALDRLHVHATFFAIGSQEQYFSAGTIAEIKSGDAIGDHTETHPMMATLSPHDQYEELFDQMAQIEVIGGRRPRLFRPPYGSFDATTFKELHHLHLLMVLWSVDTSDYTLPGVSAIVHTALAGAKPGAIILMHDGGGNREETIAALPAIVRGLRKRGLHPVTVPQLLEDDPPPHGLPLPTNLSGD